MPVSATATWTSTSRTGPRSSSKAISTTGSKAGKSTSNRGSHRRRRRRPGGCRRATAKRTRRAWLVRRRRAKRPPAFPERVGVVRVLRGDAQYDIQKRDPRTGPTVDILIKDATVRGSDAPTSIANGISTGPVGRRRDYRRKGAGAIPNLQAFSTEQLAGRLRTYTPVVTGVADHTDDRLIADRVTDVRRSRRRPLAVYRKFPRGSSRGRVTPLAQQLGAAYETFQQGTKTRAGTRRGSSRRGSRPEGLSPVYYKAAIAVLVLLLLVITGLWLGVI